MSRAERFGPFDAPVLRLRTISRGSPSVSPRRGTAPTPIANTGLSTTVLGPYKSRRSFIVRTLIVDDEPPARNLIAEYLQAFNNDHSAPGARIDVIGKCGNGRTAVEEINQKRPDLVFLDVEMPGLDGFDVLEQIDFLPHIIFSTAYDEYAIQAFDAGAIDYLLKPYSQTRFQTAVERALEHHEQDQEAYADRLATLLQEVRGRRDDAPNRLYVRHGEKIIPVDPEEIQWIEAAGDYSKLHTAEQTYLSSAGIGKLEDRLDTDRFLRIHRSHIIAFPYVDHLHTDGSGGYRVHLDDGTRLRVSRTYAPQVRERIV